MRTFFKRKRVWVPLAGVLLYTLLGFAVFPAVLKQQLLARLPAVLHRPVEISEIRFNPYALALSVRGARVTQADGSPFVSFDELFIDAAFWRLVRGRVAFDDLRLVRPSLTVALDDRGALSFADLLAPDPNAPPSPPKDPNARPTAVAIDVFELIEGSFTFRDLQRAEPFEARLTPLTLSLKDFTTAPNTNSPYAFNARLGEATLGYTGEFSADPLTSRGSISMQGIALKAFKPYLDEQTQLKLTDGIAGLEGKYDFDASSPNLRFVLTDGRVTLRQLQIEGPGEKEPLFSLGELLVTIPRVDAAARQVELGEVILKDGVLRARRDQDGTVQWARLAGPAARRQPRVVDLAPDAGTAPPGAPLAVGGAPDAGSDGPPPAAPGASAPAAPWRVALSRAALQGWSVRWEDLALRYPAKMGLEALELEVKNLRYPLEGALDTQLSFRWSDQGTLSLRGSVTPQPLAAQLALEVKDFELAPFDSYTAERMEGTLQKGRLTTSLTLGLFDGGARQTVQGELRLAGFSLLDPEDRPLLALRELALLGLDFQSAPAPALSVKTVKLAGLTTRLELAPDGALNFSRLARQAPAAPAEPPAPAPTAPGPSPTAKVATVELEDLNLDWLDRTTQPAFASSLSRLRGKVGNLTWPIAGKVQLALSARLDQAPWKLNGSVRPNGKDSVADLTFNLDGYDLPHATPYSVKYVAQPIAKGKLALALRYKVAAHALEAENRLQVDQLEFADAVEAPGPEATRLPLGLATAILADREGRIDLELPITGSLDDPEFGYGRIILKTLKNVLTKVATAPFSFFAKLLGGADPEALRQVAFAPGAVEPSPEEAAKVATLAKVLAQRPQLKLELSPGADPVLDREALARQALQRALARAAGLSGRSQGQDAGALLLLEPEAYQRAVRAAWLKRTGLDAGTPSFEVMEGELLGAQPVDDGELDRLRRARAEWLQGALAEQGIEVARIFLLQPGAEATPNTAASVSLGLK